MAKPAKKYQDELDRIKKNIDGAWVYFRENNDRFHDFQRFVYQTALRQEDRAQLAAFDKPELEFNIVYAPVSRLCGEFSKQEPSIYTSALNEGEVDPATIEVVEGIIRHALYEANKKNTQYNVYRDQLTGGFSSYKVFTEYVNEMSFDQVIRFSRTYEPTYVLFDPMAREVTKCDAKYSTEIFPMTFDDFKAEYPDVDVDKFKFRKGTNNAFAWSFKEGNEKIVIVGDYYEEKKKRKQIVKITGNRVMTMDGYKKLLEMWDRSEQAPVIIGEPRWTTLSYRCRYVICESEVLKYEETDFKYPPHVFVDGDSVIIKNGDSSSFQQFTKPYIYHAEGIQRLTNFAGQVMANEFENTTMSKFMIAEEALPDQEAYLDAIRKPQIASTIVTKAYTDSEDGESKPLPPPQPVPRQPLPDGIMEVFSTSMQMLQNILGAYDAALGIQNQELSGVAIVEGATQSNAAAMPYVVNNMLGLNQVAQVMVDLIPKYYITPRTIPIIGKDGQHRFVEINKKGGISLNYNPNVLQVKVEAGVNFAIAKNRALQQIIAIMQAYPPFAQFMMDDGLDIILDNMEFRGVDLVKEAAKRYMKEKKEQAAKNPPPPPPEVTTANAKMMDAQTNQMKAQEEVKKNRLDAFGKMADIKMQRQANAIDLIKALTEAQASQRELQAAEDKAAAEVERSNADLAISLHEADLKSQDQEHQHLADILRLAKELSEPSEKNTDES